MLVEPESCVARLRETVQQLCERQRDHAAIARRAEGLVEAIVTSAQARRREIDPLIIAIADVGKGVPRAPDAGCHGLAHMASPTCTNSPGGSRRSDGTKGRPVAGRKWQSARDWSSAITSSRGFMLSRTIPISGSRPWTLNSDRRYRDPTPSLGSAYRRSSGLNALPSETATAHRLPSSRSRFPQRTESRPGYRYPTQVRRASHLVCRDQLNAIRWRRVAQRYRRVP